MTCPFLTMLLKSAPSHWMLPDTWLPTCTVVTACSVPVAPTVSTMSPRLSGAVLTCSSVSPRREYHAPAPAPTARMMTTRRTARFMTRPFARDSWRRAGASRSAGWTCWGMVQRGSGGLYLRYALLGPPVYRPGRVGRNRRRRSPPAETSADEWSISRWTIRFGARHRGRRSAARTTSDGLGRLGHGDPVPSRGRQNGFCAADVVARRAGPRTSASTS